MATRCHSLHNTETPQNRQHPRKSIGFEILGTGGGKSMPTTKENSPLTVWRNAKTILAVKQRQTV